MDQPTRKENRVVTSPAKCSLKLATMRATILIGCYRKSDANDPEIYTTAVVAVLTRYSPEIAIAVTEPATGLPRKSKWLPSIAEIVDACNEHDSSKSFQTYWQGIVENMVTPREKTAYCHFWLRAAELGHPEAKFELEKYSSETIAKAIKMSLQEAVEIIPKSNERLYKNINEYPQLQHLYIRS